MKKLLCTFIIFFLSAGPIIAKTGLPIPRFVSLRANQINVRVGPGRHYPIEWVYVKANYPVEIIAEYDNWRKIRDVEGSQGWVHQSMLSGNRYVLVHPATTKLRSKPNNEGPVIAEAAEGVIGKLNGCKGIWCRVQIGAINGWLPKSALWGVDREKNDNS